MCELHMAMIGVVRESFREKMMVFHNFVVILAQERLKAYNTIQRQKGTLCTQ